MALGGWNTKLRRRSLQQEMEKLQRPLFLLISRPRSEIYVVHPERKCGWRWSLPRERGDSGIPGQW